MLTVIGSVLGGFKKTLRGLFFSPGFPRSLQSFQAVAASLSAGIGMAMVESPVSRVRFTSSVAAAAGESMVVDVIRTPISGGPNESLLDAPYTFDHTTGAGVFSLTVKGGVLLMPGDIIDVTRVYVAGGATMNNNAVQVDFYGDAQP